VEGQINGSSGIDAVVEPVFVSALLQQPDVRNKQREHRMKRG
jgi:hypothetical protein